MQSRCQRGIKLGNHDAQLCLLPVAAVAAAAAAATIAAAVSAAAVDAAAAAAVSAAAAATSVTATVPVRDLLEDLRKLRCRHLLV